MKFFTFNFVCSSNRSGRGPCTRPTLHRRPLKAFPRNYFTLHSCHLAFWFFFFFSPFYSFSDSFSRFSRFAPVSFIERDHFALRHFTERSFCSSSSSTSSSVSSDTPRSPFPLPSLSASYLRTLVLATTIAWRS